MMHSLLTCVSHRPVRTSEAREEGGQACRCRQTCCTKGLRARPIYHYLFLTTRQKEPKEVKPKTTTTAKKAAPKKTAKIAAPTKKAPASKKTTTTKTATKANTAKPRTKKTAKTAAAPVRTVLTSLLCSSLTRSKAPAIVDEPKILGKTKSGRVTKSKTTATTKKAPIKKTAAKKATPKKSATPKKTEAANPA